MSDWKFTLAKSVDLNRIGELTQARQRVLQITHDKAGSFGFEVPLDDSLSSSIAEASTCVIAARNDQPIGTDPIYKARWSGPVWTCNEDASANKLTVGCVGWSQTLEKHVVKPQTPGLNLVFAATDQTTIASTLLGQAIADSVAQGAPYFVFPGAVPTTGINRYRTYQPWTPIGPEIEALSQVEAGFDFLVDPITRKMNLYWGQVAGTIYGRGQVRSTSIFGWDHTTPGNASQVTRTGDASRLCNRMYVVGKNNTTVMTQDTNSMSRYGLYEEVTNIPDVADSSVLQAFANAEVAVRASPIQLTNFVPFPWTPTNGVPRIFVDYDIGDIVYVSAHRGRLQLAKQAVRLFGATINVDNNGVERVTALQTTATG